MCLLKSIAWSNVTPRSLDLGRTFALRDPKQPTTLETHTHTITFNYIFKNICKTSAGALSKNCDECQCLSCLVHSSHVQADFSLFFFFLFCHRSHFSFTWVQCWHPSLGRCWHPKGWQVFLTSSSPSSSLLGPPPRGRLGTGDTVCRQKVRQRRWCLTTLSSSLLSWQRDPREPVKFINTSSRGWIIMKRSDVYCARPVNTAGWVGLQHVLIVILENQFQVSVQSQLESSGCKQFWLYTVIYLV